MNNTIVSDFCIIEVLKEHPNLTFVEIVHYTLLKPSIVLDFIKKGSRKIAGMGYHLTTYSLIQ